MRVSTTFRWVCFLLLVALVPAMAQAQGFEESGIDDPLVMVLLRKDYAAAERLLADGYPVAGRASFLHAPGFWAIARADGTALRLLLKFGLSADHEWGFGKGNLLTNAVQLGHLELVKILCEAGASVNREPRFGRSPLGASVIYERLDVEAYLRGRGAKYNDWDFKAFKTLRMEPK